MCNGSLSTRIAGNLNISITGIDGEQLLPALHNLAVSSMTACATSSTHPSYVLRALGVDDSLAKSSLRLSIGRFTTAADLENAFEILRKAIVALR